MSKDKDNILKIEFGKKSCLLLPITDEEYYEYSKQGIHIKENYMDSIFLINFIESLSPNIQYPHFYMALKGLFGDGDISYDRYKCSFGYLFLLKIMDKRGESSIYTLSFTDVKSSFSFYFKKILATQKEFEEYQDIPKDVLHEPFEDFSKDDIKEFQKVFMYHLLSYIIQNKDSYNEEFIRYQNYDFFIYGYKDDSFFVKEYDASSQEEQNKFYEEKKKLEDESSKKRCLESWERFSE